jgi:TIGR03009 family protein
MALMGFSCQANAQQQQQQFNNQAAQQQQQSNNQRQRQVAPQNQAGVNQRAQATAQQPQRPFAELDQGHAQLLDRILDLWQDSSGQVNQYTCDFRRWDYDPTFCNDRDPSDNRMMSYQISDGVVRFANPDKGMFETTIVRDYSKDENGTVAYNERKDRELNHEKWICDGTAIYEFDYPNKRLYQMAIPAEMQGNGLVNSPLPFLFGVEKQIIKERYWIRVITPQQVQKTEIWLEAFPKNMNDARNYQRLEIILSQQDWMPKMLHIYAPNYDAKTNPISRVFEFGNRKVNSQLAKVQNIMGFFVRPKTPLGWERVDRMALASQQNAEPPLNVGQNPNSANQGQPRR